MRLRPGTALLYVACAWSAVALMCAPGVAAAVTTAIDDSGTVVLSPSVPMRWQALSPRHTDGVLMTGSTTVRVRLNLTPWLQHSGRIYLVFPAQQPGAIRATWSSQGRLLGGEVTSGSRTLVYSGPISTPLLEDVLQLAIFVDGRQMHQGYDLNFRFEMDAT
jgi:hypothetical protein